MDALNAFFKKCSDESRKRLNCEDVSRDVLFRVFIGCESNQQILGFKEAMRELTSKHFHLIISVEYLDCFALKKDLNLARHPSELVDWLLDSDIHIILTHIHQNMKIWSCDDLVRELQRLRIHPGFPSGDFINCPVFLQDKYEYIQALEKAGGLCIPTLKIDLPKSIGDNDILSSEQITKIDSFISTHGNCAAGYVVKYPFVTNSEGIQFCYTKERVLQMSRRAMFSNGENVIGRLPYVMIQPKVRNRKEYKVVLLSGKAFCIYKDHITRKDSSAWAPNANDIKKVYEFAESAAIQVKEFLPSLIAEGILRVDVMKINDKLVVNEFESLEARYEPASGDLTSQIIDFTRQYWFDVIEKLLMSRR